MNGFPLKQLFSICLMTAGVLLLYSCEKAPCGDAEVKVITLSPKQTQAVHYKGADTITCEIDNNVQTLISQYRQEYFNTVSDGKSCEGVNKKLQGYQILLKNASDSLYHNQNRSFLTDSNYVLYVTFKQVSFEITEERLGSTFYTIPEMSVNGIVYHNVYRNTNSNNDSIYYSLEKGVIRFKAKGHILQLL